MTGCDSTERKVTFPTRYVLVRFDEVTGEEIISGQGELTSDVFKRRFLDHYELAGYRRDRHPSDIVVGVLVAHDEHHLISIPLLRWKKADGSPGFVCQASSDGSPPEFSAQSDSLDGLVNRIVQGMKE